MEKYNLPDPFKQVNTIGIINCLKFKNHLSDLWVAVIEQFKKLPDHVYNGGNDKEFFSFEFQGIKLFVAKNEINGLTVMFPDEY